MNGEQVVKSLTEDCDVDGHCFHFVGIQNSVIPNDAWSSKHVCCFCGAVRYLVKILGDGNHGPHVEEAQYQPGSYFADYNWTGKRDRREGARSASINAPSGFGGNQIDDHVAASSLEEWLR